MSRETRILLVMAVLAVGGVTSLALMARRYVKILDVRPAAATRPVAPAAAALVEVDAFIEVRRTIRRAIDAQSGGGSPAAPLRSARDEGLRRSGMSSDRYARIRTLYREWREGRLAARHPLAYAFEQRRRELGELDLGDYEPLDS